jgi:ABC-type multidrug transport system ATPase subunit
MVVSAERGFCCDFWTDSWCVGTNDLIIFYREEGSMSLEITGITKTYANGVKALGNVNLSMEKGMFGLLGPNGAGKSSLMRTLATLQPPDSGDIKFNDIDVLNSPESLRAQLGYLPQEFGVYPKATANDLLDYLAQLKGIANAKERKELVAQLLEMTNLTDVKKRAVSTYSGGMKQRFGIAQALIGNPKLIIVDEPTAGLDPQERVRFYNILSDIGEEVTVLLSTHIVTDVSDLCSNFAIMNKGKVLVKTTPEKAIQSLEGKIFSKLMKKNEADEMESIHKVVSSRFKSGNILLKVFADQCPEGFDAEEVDLEDYYFAHIKGFINA